MAFVLTEIELVGILGVVLVVVYVTGTYRKHRILTRYAHWFEERFSSQSKVKFASYGHAGLRIKCQMNDPSVGFKDLEFAITLGARENLIYYLYGPLAHDFDRVNCWGSLNKPVGFYLRVSKARRKLPLTWETASIEEVNIPELQSLGYVVYSSGKDYATQLIRRARAASTLKDLTSVESFEFDPDPSRLHLVARLRITDLPRVLDFITLLARAA